MGSAEAVGLGSAEAAGMGSEEPEMEPAEAPAPSSFAAQLLRSRDPSGLGAPTPPAVLSQLARELVARESAWDTTTEPTPAQREALVRYLGWRMKYVPAGAQKIAAANMVAATGYPTPGGVQYLQNIRGLWRAEEAAREYVARASQSDPSRLALINDLDGMLEPNRRILLRSFDPNDEMHRLMRPGEVEMWRRKALEEEAARLRQAPNQQAVEWWIALEPNVKAVVYARINDEMTYNPTSHRGIEMIEEAYREVIRKAMMWWDAQDELVRRYYALRFPTKQGADLAMAARAEDAAKRPR